MCWSAEADAVAGLVVGAIAIDALRHVEDRRQLPLASLPVVLAAHQLIEVAVWWHVEGNRIPAFVGRAAIYAYLFIAFAIPLLVPAAVAAIEPDDRRRQLMERLGAVGALVAVVLLAGVALGPVGARDGGNHIAYQAKLFHGGELTAVYVFVTLGALFASSHRFIVTFGMLNLAAVGALTWVTMSGFVSLWCGWAAVASLVIALHLRHAALEPKMDLDVDGERRLLGG